MNLRTLILSAALALSADGLQAQTAAQIHSDYLARTTELDDAHIAAQLRALRLSPEASEALEFLYAYMPWPDAADRTAAYFAAQTECALRARREMPWGSKVPQREWLHFVLPVRVNNESLDTFRTARYEELKQRVRGLTMEQAVLEVNHWCHEHVTYKPSDSRTSPPLATLRTATGRCGEESTLTVAALRTVGIPARQVYTPRWAHTDDNHAWVEAWVDGKWRFLGACEPEAVLDLGWFNQPASRGMLMHTKVFGKYDGPEDVISRDRCFTEINVTANYAQTARTVVQITDAQGRPAAGASVDFKIYNYGELYSVQRTKADSQGRAAIRTGLGDMVAWAAKDGRYGFAKFTAGKDTLVSVSLERRSSKRYEDELTLVPPKGTYNIPEVSPEAAALNLRRLAYEDSLRHAYVATFADSARTDSLCRALALDFARVRALTVKACGNWPALFQLLEEHPQAATLDLLETLTDKDLRDFVPEVMFDHIQFLPPQAHAAGEKQSATQAQRAFRLRYVACPRIANETLSPWRSYFAAAFDEADKKRYAAAPDKLARWIDSHVLSNPESNPQGYWLSPAQAAETHRADARNKGLLFVAACRSIGVPARIDEVTGRVQYADPEATQSAPTDSTVRWLTVDFGPNTDGEGTTGDAMLALDYTPRKYMENPAYYYHFTLSKMEEGRPVLQNYPETATWQADFSRPRPVPAGDYLLTSGTRMADGTVLARLSAFPAGPKADESEKLVMREDKQGVQVIGSFNAENLYRDAASGTVKSLLSTTGRGYYVVALLRANHEPSNHILHDIEKLRSELEAWGRPILLLFPDEDEYGRFCKNNAEFGNLPATVSYGIDTEGQVQADLFGSSLLESKEQPVVAIADTFNRVLFVTQGYTIGVGERIKTTVGKLD